MLKKSYLRVLLAAIGIFVFSFGMAQAAQIDGLETSGAIPALPATLHVYNNPGGLGDALIFGTYNARGAFNFLRVVNTSTSVGIGAKVRFREAKNSNEVLDFVICLSAGDQWSAWVSDFGDSASPAKLLWWDNDTPTYPDPQGDDDATNNIPSDLVGGSIPFAYSATGAASSVTLDDTKQGYLEVIGISGWADTPGTGKTVKTPNACGAQVGIAGVTETGFTPSTRIDVPNNLMGSLYTIKNFVVAPYNATALANFRGTAFGAGSISLATDNPPLLDNASDGTTTADHLDAVNYVLTKTTINAMYDIETSIGGATDIVLTFPTKRLSILDLTDNGPFNDCAVIDSTGVIGNNSTVGSSSSVLCRCERVDISVWNDSEGQTTTKSCQFSPCTPQSVTFTLCNESNVVTIGGASTKSVLNPESTVENLVDISTGQTTSFDIGYVQFDMTTHELNASGVEKTGSTRVTDFGTGHANGMPVIGYSVGSFLGGDFSSMVPVTYDVTH